MSALDIRDPILSCTAIASRFRADSDRVGTKRRITEENGRGKSLIISTGRYAGDGHAGRQKLSGVHESHKHARIDSVEYLSSGGRRPPAALLICRICIAAPARYSDRRRRLAWHGALVGEWTGCVGRTVRGRWTAVIA